MKDENKCGKRAPFTKRKKLHIAAAASVLAILLAALCIISLKGGDGGHTDTSAEGTAASGESGAQSADFPSGEVFQPSENTSVTYEETRLSRALGGLDMRCLCIKGATFHTASGRVMKTDFVYGVKGGKVCFTFDNGEEDYCLLSDGSRVVGLDFEASTYTVTGLGPFAADMMLPDVGGRHCTFTGKEAFFGRELDFEEYLVNPKLKERLRYCFNEDGGLAGYLKYVGEDISETVTYEYIGNVFPDDAALYFEIPDGFTENEPALEASEIFGG